MTRIAPGGFASTASRRRRPAPPAPKARGADGAKVVIADAADDALTDQAKLTAMDKPDALIVFTPSGRRGRFPYGTPVLQAARALGVDIDSVCGGRGICGRCQINLAEGEFAKHGIVSTAAHLSEISEVEEAYGKRKMLAEGRRLSCSTKILGDVVIDVPETSQVHRQIVRKAVEAVAIELDPAIRLYYVEVA